MPSINDRSAIYRAHYILVKVNLMAKNGEKRSRKNKNGLVHDCRFPEDYPLQVGDANPLTK
jgi:hypothetical protein